MNVSSTRMLCVFDVESIGLHGEGFAVAYRVMNAAGEAVESNEFSCDPALALGRDEDRAWVAANVPTLARNCATPAEVRAKFWQRWLHWREAGAWLAADCSWPVEAAFLAACVRDGGDAAHWQGPYPLLDISTLTFALGRDPRDEETRLPDELPLHDPAADVRHSARKLQQALTSLATRAIP